jgi:hypothetical protein
MRPHALHPNLPWHPQAGFWAWGCVFAKDENVSYALWAPLTLPLSPGRGNKTSEECSEGVLAQSGDPLPKRAPSPFGRGAG